MSDELVARVIQVIAKTQHIAPESVTIDKTFEELKIDSLDGINILFAMENEFGLDIPDDAAQSLRTVREMVDGIEKLLVDKKQAAKEQAAKEQAAKELAGKESIATPEGQ